MENFLYGKGHHLSGKNKSMYNEKISLSDRGKITHTCKELNKLGITETN